MLALLLLPPAWAELTGAGHHGVAAGPSIEWESTFIGVLEPDGETTLRLLKPLDPEVELLSVSQGELRPVRDAEGRTVALALSDYPRRATRYTLKLRQPASSRLQPPLFDQDDLLQRVTLEGLVYTPDADEGLERHLDFMAHPDIDRRERRSLDRLVEGKRARVAEQPIYLQSGPRLEEGLRGEAQAISERRGAAGFVVGGLFAVVLVVLAGLYRVLDRRAKEETVEAYIKGEFIAAVQAEGAPGLPSSAPRS